MSTHPRWTDTGITFFAPGEVRPSMWLRELVALGWDDEGLQRAADEFGIPDSGPRLDVPAEAEGRPRLERRRELFDLVIALAMENAPRRSR